MPTAKKEPLPFEGEIDLEIVSNDAIIFSIEEALDLLDNAIAEISYREIVPVSEMTDLLLDIRLALVPLVL